MEITNNTPKDLPHSTTILVLGILSLIFCWCYGLIGLVLGIIAVALSNGQRRLYWESPGEYTEDSYRSVNSGRTCGIIAICISAVIMLIVLVFFMGVFSLFALSNL